MPLGVSAVLGGGRQLLLESGRRSADDRHLRGRDLREDLAARDAGLGERAVRAGEHVPQLDQPGLGVLADGEHRVDLPAHVLQGARLTVVRRGVRLSAAGGRTARRGLPEGERVGDHLLAQRGEGAGDALQVVARRVLPGAYADGVREPAGALEFGGQQVYPGGQRRPHRVGGDDHVQARRVQLVHPLHERHQREPFAEFARSAVQGGCVGRGGRRARDRDRLAAQQLGQLHQVLAAGPAAAGADLAGRAQRVRVRVEVRPQQGDRRVGGLPALLGHPGELGAFQQPAARVVLEGEEGGLDRLVLRAEPRQRTVHLVPVHHRPGGPVTPIDHLSLLKGCCGWLSSVAVVRGGRQLVRRYCGGGGSDFAESLASVADSHLSYDACQPSVVSLR